MKKKNYILPGQYDIFRLQDFISSTAFRPVKERPSYPGLYECIDIDGKSFVSPYHNIGFSPITNRPVTGWRILQKPIDYYKDKASSLDELLVFYEFFQGGKWKTVTALCTATTGQEKLSYFTYQDYLDKAEPWELKEALYIMHRFPKNNKKRIQLCKQKLETMIRNGRVYYIHENALWKGGAA